MTQAVAHRRCSQIAVSTPEERQVIEQIISRGGTRVVYRQVTTVRKTKIEKAREELPTAWQRLLRDDDEEGAPCPTKTERTAPPPPKAPAKKPQPKPRAPKNAKG